MAQFQKRQQQPQIDPAIAALRIPPHSVEAEQSVIGGLLLDNSAYDKISDLISIPISTATSIAVSSAPYSACLNAPSRSMW